MNSQQKCRYRLVGLCGTDASMNAVEVLVSVRGYIKHFFGCEECRKNFLRGARHMDDTVLSNRDAVLFLWRSHNKANYWLRRDVTEDPHHPKVQFPDISQCSTCHVTLANGSVVWNEESVFQFLQQMYSGTSVIRDSESAGMQPVNYRNGIMKKPFNSANHGVTFTFVQNNINATQLDISLCLAFYGLCTGLLALLYYRFCQKCRSRKNSSSHSLV